MELASVWPLEEGLKGINRFTNDVVILNTYQKGFMYLEDAKKLQDQGKLQLMVGLDMQSLKQPGDNPLLKKDLKAEALAKELAEGPATKQTAVKKKSTYKTKVVTPQD